MEWRVTHGYTSATVVKEQFFTLENIIFASLGDQELFLLLKISWFTVFHVMVQWKFHIWIYNYRT